MIRKWLFMSEDGGCTEREGKVEQKGMWKVSLIMMKRLINSFYVHTLLFQQPMFICIQIYPICRVPQAFTFLFPFHSFHSIYFFLFRKSIKTSLMLVVIQFFHLITHYLPYHQPFLPTLLLFSPFSYLCDRRDR